MDGFVVNISTKSYRNALAFLVTTIDDDVSDDWALELQAGIFVAS